LSVDAKLEPYINASMLIESNQVKIGRCDKLKKELEALVLNKGKVTRTTELKDLADVLTGALYNAQLNYLDSPQYQYKTIQEEQIKEVNYNDYLSLGDELLIDL
jgi:hypothetical protein